MSIRYSALIKLLLDWLAHIASPADLRRVSAISASKRKKELTVQGQPTLVDLYVLRILVALLNFAASFFNILSEGLRSAAFSQIKLEHRVQKGDSRETGSLSSVRRQASMTMPTIASLRFLGSAAVSSVMQRSISTDRVRL